MGSNPALYMGDPESNIGQKIGYPDEGFRDFSVLRVNASTVSHIKPRRFPSTIFKIHYSLIILAFNAILQSEQLTA
jgi:hypothetical protein